MKYSLFGNDELGWTVFEPTTKMFFCFDTEIGSYWDEHIGVSDLTTKEKAEEKLKELQDEK